MTGLMLRDEEERKVDAEGASSAGVGGWGWEQLIHCLVMVVHPHCSVVVHLHHLPLHSSNTVQNHPA